MRGFLDLVDLVIYDELWGAFRVGFGVSKTPWDQGNLRVLLRVEPGCVGKPVDCCPNGVLASTLPCLNNCNIQYFKHF